MTQWVQPASTISANSFCKSLQSGVVSDAGSAFSPTIFCTVPTRPQRIPALSKMPFNSMVVVVLPFVPVTPIKVRCFAGQP